MLSPARGPEEKRRQRSLLLCIAGLVFMAVCAHGGGLFNGFVDYDDGLYVFENKHVLQGLTPGGMAWAFQSLAGGNWNPAVWLSHQLVVSLAGVDPFWHHFLNLLLHVCNVVLFFLLLRTGSGALVRSALAAALFAVHPIHVESVAWVAERKDVLSLFFCLLCLLCYVRYARTRCRAWYGSAVLLLLLGLMAKAMLVVVPVLLLLLDYWPLQRVRWQSPDGFFCANRQLLLEKMPFFLLSCCAAGITLYAQRHAGALAPLQEFSVWQRLANILTSYTAYLGKAVWPVDLAVLYPLRAAIPLWKSIASGVLIVGMSAASIRYARRFPYLLTGWWWYFTALLPVIGVVQVGVQSMADRYAYLPFLGAYALLVWAGADLVRGRLRSARQRGLALLAVCLVLGALAAGSRAQTRHWRDGERLFTHALAVTEGNYQIHRALAEAYVRTGAADKALQELRAALKIRPDAKGYWLLAFQLLKMGREQEALERTGQGLELFPDHGGLHKLRGLLLYRKGQKEQAAEAFATALRLHPDDGEALKNLRILQRELAGRSETVVSPDGGAGQ